YYGNYEPSLIRGGTSRVPNYCHGKHFFAEHGHRWDSNNRDGNALGYTVSQAAVRWPSYRSIEGSSRNRQMDAAALLFFRTYYGHQPDSLQPKDPFFVYVMGHTHEGCL